MNGKTGPSPTASPLQISIIGGGQLAQMIAQAATQHQVHVHALADSPVDPVLSSPAQCHFQNSSSQSLKAFLELSPHTTFENEFVNADQLAEISRATRTSFYPSLHCLKTLQNKLFQKELLKGLGIRCAPFVKLDKHQNPQAWIQSLSQTFSENCVLKWSTFGYDGKGTFFLTLNDASCQARALVFIQEGLAKGAEIFAEEKISFRYEAAQVACRSANGTNLFYPLVLSVQEAGICSEVQGPASRFLETPDVEKHSAHILEKILKHLNYVGVIAVEFFINSSGNLFVNEIAPRVHNTGHYSQNASSLSQFQAHALAPFDLLPETIQHKNYFGMLNILGPELKSYDRKTPSLQSPSLASSPNVFFHWYGKTRIQKGRKLGHINFFADSFNDFKNQQEQAKRLRLEILKTLQEESLKSL